MLFWKKKNTEKTEFDESFLSGTDNSQEKNKILAVITHFVDGILVFDRNNKLILINPQVEKITGVGKEQVLGKSIFDLNSFKSFQPLVSLLGGEIKEIFRKEVQISAKCFLEVSSIPMSSQTEKIGTLIILHDVTREKLVETMKSEFVTLAAHQLRTPTSGIKWSLRMLLDEDLGAIPESQKKVIEKAYNTNDKVIRLINDLLNVARIEEGKFLSKMVLYDIIGLVQEVVEIYREDIERKNLQFEFKKPQKGLPKLMLDVDKMKIAVDNLLDNAIKYTLPGGKLIISITEKNKEIEIQIHDTGVGIPENEQDKIFSKFFRGENIMKMETEGTGLGLFIAKYIIEAHGGRIWFESEEGEGTIFYFTIPVKKEFAEYLTGEFY